MMLIIEIFKIQLKGGYFGIMVLIEILKIELNGAILDLC